MSTENTPILLTGPMCMAMPVGTAVELAEPRHGVWHAKTSEITWAFFWRTRPTPEQIWQAVEERTNNLSPYPSGLAYVYEPPEYPDATPAPLDPSKVTETPIDPHAVKPGDTVVVRFIQTGDEITTKAYRPEDIKAGRWVSVLGWPLVKADGTFGLAVKHFELLAHQPAPEPEWEPGTVAVVVQPGYPGAGVDDHEFRAALQTDGTWVGLAGEAATVAPTSVRPLVVIDPMKIDVGAVRGATFKAYDTGIAPVGQRERAAIRAALVELGLGGAR